MKSDLKLAVFKTLLFKNNQVPEEDLISLAPFFY